MVKVDAKGRIVLPKALRERLGISPGSQVSVREEDGKAVVDPGPAPEELIDRLERLVAAVADERDGPVDDMHPIASDHASTIRRQATDRVDE